MTPASGPPVLAAVDGSESSTAALRWAARAADRRHCALRIVSVHQWPVSGYPDSPAVGRQLRADMDAQSRAVLDAAEVVVADTAPGVAVTTEVLEGEVVPTLRAAGEGAALTVLGSRGVGGFSGLLLGSVSAGLTARGSTPVVVVRGDGHGGAGVLAGVDGGDGDEAVLRFAFAQAAVEDTAVTVAHAWGGFAMDGLSPGGYPGIDWTPVAANAEDVVSRALRPWRDEHPGITVERVVSRASPASLLVDLSQRACLVVVGSRGRGRLAGLLLGSTSQALVRHAGCPVAVVRPDVND
ncbi:universal stress protein [Actinokineospora pegani]|uniref:universal stress protein n=1 Tax=Actinokineospora pegani TaxID=2654637 RepID=UPI0012E9D34F|nr:universal stress protein [Actinokineospora pegani]